MRWPTAEPIENARLHLEPLCVDDAAPQPTSCRAGYTKQVAGRSDDGTQSWLNWVVRHRDSGAVVGTVQASEVR